MLQPGDTELVAREPAIQGLGALLDSQAFAAALGDALSEHRVGTTIPFYARYKPGTSCLVAFRTSIDDQPVIVYAKAHRIGDERKAEKSLRDTSPASSLGPNAVPLPTVGLVACRFPYDAELPVLDRIFDEDRRPHMLERIVGSHPKLWGGHITPLRYKPERRLVARLDAPPHRAALRFYTARGFASVDVSSRLFRSRKSLKVARRLGAWKRRFVMATEWVDGVPLGAPGTASRLSPSVCARTGVALAELHAQTNPSLADRQAEWVDGVRAGTDAVAQLLPALAPRVFALRERILSAIAPAPARPVALHGDFYADQILLQSDRIVLLDLDRAGRGDPRCDLGTFRAHAEYQAICADGSLDDARLLSEAQIEGYATGTRRAVEPVDIYTAAALLQLAVAPFRERVGDWTDRTRRILDRVEELVDLQRAPSRAPTESTHATGAARDPLLPGLAAALDPLRAAPAIAAALERGGHATSHDVGVAEARVVRHKPGRRCLVRYAIRAGNETWVAYGKLRRRGLDLETERVSRALVAAGFGPDAPDGISVPESLGVVPELDLWLQRSVPGEPVCSRLALPDGVRSARRVADAVLKLHRTGVTTERRHDAADELRILRMRFSDLADREPQRAEAATRLLAGCARIAATLPTVTPRGIHRDLHPDQILIDGDRIALVDLDLYAMGDPALDVGNLIAHLTEYALRNLGDPSALRDCEEAFRERYLGASRVEPRSVDIHTTLALARLVEISARIPERRATTDWLIDYCGARLDGVSRERGSRSLGGTT